MKTRRIALFLIALLVSVPPASSADTSRLTPKCNEPTKRGDSACWMKASNHDDCYVWDPHPETDEKVTWSGQCKAGVPDGKGAQTWEYGDNKQISVGTMVNGEEHGKWEIRWGDGRIDDVVYDKGKEVSSTPRFNPKFVVKGDILHYNTDLAATVEGQEITFGDRDYFEKLLKENADIKIVHLTSWGGDIEEAFEISDLIIDYDLDTRAIDICFSACPTLFLGGKNRTLERGSKIGFHRSWWNVDDIKFYYEDNKEDEGWNSVFDFAAWVYEDTQEEIHRHFEFFLERGVDPVFAIKTLKADSYDGWYPRRKELLEANFLTE